MGNRQSRPTVQDVELGSLTDLPNAAPNGTGTAPVPNSINEPEHTLLLSIAGHEFQMAESEAFYLASTLRPLTSGNYVSQLEPLLNAQFHSAVNLDERFLGFASRVIEILRRNPNMSISRIVGALQQENALKPDLAEEDLVVSKHVVFLVLGAMSHLYVPIQHTNNHQFQVDVQGSNCPNNTLVDFDRGQRPLDELLRAFGAIFPEETSIDPDSRRFGTEPTKFNVSGLNAATLKELAGIKIIWVDSLSAHLDFDTSIPALYVFRGASFCRLQAVDSSLISLLATDKDSGEEHPMDPSYAARLMREIMLSYQILFRDERSARKLYQKCERAQAAMTLPDGTQCIDPWLDRLCGQGLSTFRFSFGEPVRETYDADTDFPILRTRLNRIHAYMDGIQPNRMTSVWKDRRDLRLWYTIWVVLIFGCINIVQTFISIFLAATQVGLAQRALEVQAVPSP